VDTYSKPEHGWTCFHCGETFKTPGAARDHFGFDPSSDPACRIKVGAERGLLMALRKAEEEIARQRDDDGPAIAAIVDEMRRMQSRHSDALRDAEQAGFERGVSDMRKHGWRLNEEREKPDLYPATNAR
jgi:phytoene dehydrogenase-like protein